MLLVFRKIIVYFLFVAILINPLGVLAQYSNNTFEIDGVKGQILIDNAEIKKVATWENGKKVTVTFFKKKNELKIEETGKAVQIFDLNKNINQVSSIKAFSSSVSLMGYQSIEPMEYKTTWFRYYVRYDYLSGSWCIGKGFFNKNYCGIKPGFTSNLKNDLLKFNEIVSEIDSTEHMIVGAVGGGLLVAVGTFLAAPATGGLSIIGAILIAVGGGAYGYGEYASLSNLNKQADFYYEQILKQLIIK